MGRSRSAFPTPPSVRKLSSRFDPFANEAQLAGYSPVGAPWTPPADVLELDDCFVVRLEVPGIDTSELSVHQQDNTLFVEGLRRRPESDAEVYSFHNLEIRYGPFERLFHFPRAFSLIDVEATYHNGLLTIRIGKTAEAPRMATFVRVQVQEKT